MLKPLFDIGLSHYLILSLILFLIGLTGVVISRNLLRIVMSIFVITTSIVINFVAFGYYCDKTMENANIMSFLVLFVTVIQMITALVILFKIYQANEYLDAQKVKDKEN